MFRRILIASLLLSSMLLISGCVSQPRDGLNPDYTFSYSRPLSQGEKYADKVHIHAVADDGFVQAIWFGIRSDSFDDNQFAYMDGTVADITLSVPDEGDYELYIVSTIDVIDGSQIKPILSYPITVDSESVDISIGLDVLSQEESSDALRSETIDAFLAMNGVGRYDATDLLTHLDDVSRFFDDPSIVESLREEISGTELVPFVFSENERKPDWG